ncbi:MAG: PAS domain S-box protein [Chitinispirillaceae bacterium]|nr:PAS domain S-box protein [Chitinispirillaceae bacterium]
MMIGKKLKELPSIIGVDTEKCVNCHACISVCPVKYCNDGSGDHVAVNPLMCIGCGQCITKCSHGARFWIDDCDRFFEDRAAGQRMIAIVAPSIASNFPSTYLNINGWLKSIGIEAVFDVSFGAELSVKSYMEYLKVSKKTPVITQPCPAIVTYIEMYLPELLPYLAPVDSPMVHAMKMIRQFYPEFAEHKIVALSPCIAKKREFVETGLGDYNVGFKSLSNYFLRNNIDLKDYSQEQYVNPPAERAVGFSTPGGLLKTAERWSPGISEVSRKIEGESIYPYLDTLADSIKNKTAPVIIDCLNCENGCNSGPLTVTSERPLDDIENAVSKRINQAESLYGGNKEQAGVDDISIEDLNQILSKFWIPDLYSRTYADMSINNRIVVPTEDELKKIYKLMRKNGDNDFYNCNACGYGTCENMAIAIYNGLNRPENCHFFLAEEARLRSAQISDNEKRLRTILSTTTAGFCLADEEFRLIVVNPSFCKTIGMDRDKLIGSIFLKKQFERCSSGHGYSSEIRVNRPDGGSGVFLFIANPYFDDHRDLVGYFAMVIDISKYKKDTAATNIQFSNGNNQAEATA